jgi:hypothetical protein
MSDLQILFLVLAIIYGWECACWLKRGSVGFITWLGRRWRVTHPGGLLGNHQGGFIFANPLPPLGTVLTGNHFPFSLSPEAVLVYVASSVNPAGRPPQTGRLLLFNEIQEIKVSGKKVSANHSLLLNAGTPTLAQHLAGQLRDLLKAEPSKRAALIEKVFQGSFDLGGIERRWKQFRTEARPLRVLANALFAYLFIFGPVLISTVGLRQCWVGLVIGLAALTLSISLLFRKLHQKFYPLADDERFTHFIIVLLSPATAIRALDVLSRPVLETFHPLALAKVFGREQQFTDLAGSMLRELRHPALPVCPREEASAQKAERYSRELLLKVVERFLKENGLDLTHLMRSPTPIDESCRSYCPRCLAQFTTDKGVCADCGGLPTIPFVSKKPATQPA